MVTEQCVVKFNIGNYLDEVLCDIMPIDCFHILLGGPCQYDRYAMDDGILNQYTLWVNGRKKVLLPLIESPDEMNCTTMRICMVSGNKFEKEM